ncbi:polynucleotide adenylyltransferase PcnB [Marinifaba aquimaris]|uniref:polynucleotide adenylyltransferase PcnB n=1 Tax=Marinifaba aquimaris TaxID=2741323 RepID=UPI0031B60EE7
MPRDNHPISRRDIHKNALKVLYRLHDAGFEAYLVGGGVRDLLLGLKPKDFDIATNATPEQIKSLFSNCRLIGRRFRLAHIVFGRDIIEVATFRGHHEEKADGKNVSKQSEDGQLLRDNVYGTIDEDAERRDFSINALYYSIADYSIRDYWQGVEAINKRQIELIGDPETRYREDPVRMLRAVRFAIKLDMEIAPATAAPIKELAPLLNNIPAARLFEESLKLFMNGKGLATFKKLVEFGLFQQMFPQLGKTVAVENSKGYQLFCLALSNTDERIANNQRVTPAFLYATMFWYGVEARATELASESGLPSYDALQIAITEALDSNKYRIFIPKRFASMIRDIWSNQPRLHNRQGKRPFRLLEHPKFRAAYDFLLLRSEIEGGELVELAQWWTQFQQANTKEKSGLMQDVKDPSKKRGPYKKRRYNKRRSSNKPKKQD